MSLTTRSFVELCSRRYFQSSIFRSGINRVGRDGEGGADGRDARDEPVEEKEEEEIPRDEKSDADDT